MYAGQFAHLSGPLATFGVAGAGDGEGDAPAEAAAAEAAAEAPGVLVADAPPEHAARKTATPAAAVPWMKCRRLISTSVIRASPSLIDLLSVTRSRLMLISQVPGWAVAWPRAGGRTCEAPHPRLPPITKVCSGSQ
jgi:hypothetical protein